MSSNWARKLFSPLAAATRPAARAVRLNQNGIELEDRRLAAVVTTFGEAGFGPV